MHLIILLICIYLLLNLKEAYTNSNTEYNHIQYKLGENKYGMNKYYPKDNNLNIYNKYYQDNFDPLIEDMDHFESPHIILPHKEDINDRINGFKDQFILHSDMKDLSTTQEFILNNLYSKYDEPYQTILLNKLINHKILESDNRSYDTMNHFIKG